MNTIYKSMVVILILIGLWIALASTGHCEVPCHPGQHTCTTDQECEDEEALFLDMDERGSKEEMIDLYNMQYNIAPSKQLSAPTNLEVK